MCTSMAHFEPPDKRKPSHSTNSDIKREMKLKIIKDSQCIQQGPVEKYLLNTSKVNLHVDGKVRKWTFGRKDVRKPNKAIMMVGQTGSGKSTLINMMVNYILGVEWGDKFRFEIIKDEGKSQTESQTTAITVYEIFGQEGNRIPYSLTVIDTPGFGDTRGIEQDKLITQNLQELFKSENGVHHIDAVCFVVNATQNRLTITQCYIFDAILSIFGKDIENNIMAFTTFASRNEKTPPVLQALCKSGIPLAKKRNHKPVHFKFNNPHFAKHSDNENDEKKNWKMGEKSLKKFFKKLKTMETKSLQLTQEVLRERRQLEACIEGLERQKMYAMDKQLELEQTQEALKLNKDKMEANKDFEYEVDVTETIKVASDKMSTNCDICKVTCHISCPLAPKSMLFLCDVMRNKSCTVCPGKCSYKDHRKEKMKYHQSVKRTKKTFEELKQQYEAASGENITAEEVENRLQTKINESEKRLTELLETSYKCITRLEEIALKPNPMSAADYIDLLIANEKNTERVKQLLRMKERVEILDRITKDKSTPGKE